MSMEMKMEYLATIFTPKFDAQVKINLFSHYGKSSRFEISNKHTFQINTMDRDFNKEILHLVDMLREVSKRQKSDSVLNLVLKLDFNHYLTKMAAAEA